MVSYLDFKKMVNKIFDGDDEIELNSDICVSRDVIKDNSIYAIEWTINNDELLALYNEIQNYTPQNEAELYLDNYYEVPVKSNMCSFLGSKFKVTSEDKVNGIKYNLGASSLKYAVYVLLRMMDSQKQTESILRKIKYRNFSFVVERLLNEDENEVNWERYLILFFNIDTIKISTLHKVDYENFIDYCASFQFVYMHESKMDLSIHNNLNDIIMFDSDDLPWDDYISEIEPPKLIFKRDIVNYYCLGISSFDPFISYISFYHVIEYFYDEIFKRNIVKILKDRITSPDFSYKNDDDIYSIVELVHKHVKLNGELGQGNEYNSLYYVLCEFIDAEMIKNKMKGYYRGYEYYQNNKANFCDSNIIDWGNKDVLKHIAKRIYSVRNALVHSKEGGKIYRPYKDDAELNGECLLVRVIAETIIIKTGKIL